LRTHFGDGRTDGQTDGQHRCVKALFTVVIGAVLSLILECYIRTKANCFNYIAVHSVVLGVCRTSCDKRK